MPSALLSQSCLNHSCVVDSVCGATLLRLHVSNLCQLRIDCFIPSGFFGVPIHVVMYR